MAKAVIDPDEVRRFAHDLERFNRDLQHQLNVLHGRLSALGETWRDQEHRKFAEEFELTLKVLARFSNSASEHIPFLRRKADRIEEYLRQR
jgi:uncharacterized protein YukE